MENIKFTLLISLIFGFSQLNGAVESPTRTIQHEVCLQNGNTCGYHAVNSALIFDEFLQGAIDHKTLEAQLQAQPNTPGGVFPLAEWQKKLQKPNKWELLTDDGLNRLVADHKNISVIEDIKHPQYLFSPLYPKEKLKNLAPFLRSIKKGERAYHHFIIGDMYKGKGSGHWILTTVVHDRGTMTYHYFDSIESPNTKIRKEELPHAIEENIILDLQDQEVNLVNSDVDFLVEEAADYLRRKQPKRALTSLNNALKEAQQQYLFDNNDFQESIVPKLIAITEQIAQDEPNLKEEAKKVNLILQEMTLNEEQDVALSPARELAPQPVQIFKPKKSTSIISKASCLYVPLAGVVGFIVYALISGLKR